MGLNVGDPRANAAFAGPVVAVACVGVPALGAVAAFAQPVLGRMTIGYPM